MEGPGACPTRPSPQFRHLQDKAAHHFSYRIGPWTDQLEVPVPRMLEATGSVPSNNSGSTSRMAEGVVMVPCTALECVVVDVCVDNNSCLVVVSMISSKMTTVVSTVHVSMYPMRYSSRAVQSSGVARICPVQRGTWNWEKITERRHTTLSRNSCNKQWQNYTPGRSDGGISVYVHPKSVYLKFFMWLFCLLDPFIPTQIKFLATPLTICRIRRTSSYWMGNHVESHHRMSAFVGSEATWNIKQLMGGGTCPSAPKLTTPVV